MVIFRRWLYSIKNRIWKKSLNCNKTVEKYQKLHKYCNLLNVRSSMLFSIQFVLLPQPKCTETWRYVDTYIQPNMYTANNIFFECNEIRNVERTILKMKNSRKKSWKNVSQKIRLSRKRQTNARANSWNHSV